MSEWKKVQEIGGRAIALAENFDIGKDSDPPLRAWALEDYSGFIYFTKGAPSGRIAPSGRGDE